MDSYPSTSVVLGSAIYGGFKRGEITDTKNLITNLDPEKLATILYNIGLQTTKIRKVITPWQEYRYLVRQAMEFHVLIPKNVCLILLLNPFLQYQRLPYQE